MANIAKPNTFTANTAIEPAEVNDNFDTIYNEFNGGISASNLATDAVTTAKIAAANVTNAKMADSAITPEKILTGTGTGWAWQTWSPTLSNLSGGTQTYAKYCQIGKTVHFKFKYTLAGAGVGTNPGFTLPVSASADYITTGAVSSSVLCGGELIDFTGARYFVSLLFTGTNAVTFYTVTTSYTGVTATTPFTWATSDVLEVYGTYEAA